MSTTFLLVFRLTNGFPHSKLAAWKNYCNSSTRCRLTTAFCSPVGAAQVRTIYARRAASARFSGQRCAYQLSGRQEAKCVVPICAATGLLYGQSWTRQYERQPQQKRNSNRRCSGDRYHPAFAFMGNLMTSSRQRFRPVALASAGPAGSAFLF